MIREAPQFEDIRGPLGGVRQSVEMGILIVLLLLPFVAYPAFTAWPAMVIFIVLTRISLGMRRTYLRSLREYHCLTSESSDGESDAELPPVTVVAPARNEEAGIELAVRSMLGLDYPSLRVIVVNDHSTDATGAILDRLAAEFPQLQVVHDPPLQEGWHGKVNAVWHGIQAADLNCPWILQTDADAIFHPKALRRGIAYALHEGIDFLSCVVWLANGTLSEEAVMPISWCGILTRVRQARLNERKAPVIGVGPYMLFRREAHEAVGGYDAFAAFTPEDMYLAAAFKMSGARVGAVWTRDMVRFRIYRGYGQLRRFLIRKMRIYSDDRRVELLNSVLGPLLRLVLPLPLAIAGVVVQMVAGSVSVAWVLYSLAAFAAYYSAVLSFERYSDVAYMRPFLSWAHQIGGVMRVLFACEALAQAILKRPMEWRGRRHVNVRAKR